jgi:hypothetical protein
MKRTILTVISLVGIVLGGTMMAFGNPLGDYITVISCIVSLWLMDTTEHDCSDHEKTISQSYFKDGGSGVVFKGDKEVKCTKCGKIRTV